MGQRFLIDTNILIEFLSNRLPEKGKRFIAKILDEEFLISVIREMEVLGYPAINKETELFIELATSINLNEDIVKTTINIRKNYKVKLPDAIIASTAISNNLTLVTRNVSDFKSIKKLKILNPWEM